MGTICKNENSERTIKLISLPALDPPHLPDNLLPYFGVFLVCDATLLDDKTVIDFAQALLKKGAIYFSFWGTHCERVHDLFDLAIIQNDPDETDNSVRLTSWHTKETLDEALWFFLNVAFPANDYEASCHTELLIVIANETWTQHLKKRVLSQGQLSKDVVGD